MKKKQTNKKIPKQECIPVGYVPPALYCIGGLCPGRPPRQRPPGRNMEPETETLYRNPPEGTWDQAARQEVTSYRDPFTPPPPWSDKLF